MKQFDKLCSTASFEPMAAAHANRSSEMFISPSGNVVLKSRAGRSTKKMMREFLSLSAWDGLLAHYNSEAPDEWGAIESPKPIAVNFDEKNICMSYVSGEPILRTYATPQHAMGGLATRELLAVSAYRLGRLYAIKAHEGLIHGDFAPRHILVGNHASLAVIDVESTQIGSTQEDIQDEHQQLLSKLAIGTGLGWKASVFNDAFASGTEDFISSSSRVVEEIVESINIGEKPEYNLALLKSRPRNS